MRMLFGLVGLLVVAGIIMWLSANSMQHVAKTQKEIKPQVEQMSGRDLDGTDVRKQVKLDQQSTSGKVTGYLVTDIDSESLMTKYFGLQKNDSIVEIGMGGGVMQGVKEMSTTAEAKDALLTAYQNKQQLVVMRNNEKLTLPSSNKSASPAAPAGAPAAAPAPASDSGNPLQRQLESIPGVSK